MYKVATTALSNEGEALVDAGYVQSFDEMLTMARERALTADGGLINVINDHAGILHALEGLDDLPVDVEGEYVRAIQIVYDDEELYDLYILVDISPE